MTGPLGPMDDDGVVDLLRAAGQGGPNATPADVSRAMAAGTKIRRRRQAMQVVGSGLAIAVVLGVGITTVSALDDSGGTPVTSADDVPAPAVSAEAAREANNALLLQALGPDYRMNTREEGPGVTLRKNTDTAKLLPDGYYVTASVWVGGPGDGYTGLQELCGELIEEGLYRSACVPEQTADGRTVQLQHRRSTLKPGTVGGAYNTLLAFFERADGTVAEVRMQAADDSAESPQASTGRQGTAHAWLDMYRETFVALAADPRIQSSPPRTGAPETPGTNDAVTAADYLADDMGDGWIRNNVTVVLDPDGEPASRLPQGDYQARTEAGIINQAAFDQVCKARAGLEACDARKKLSGDQTVYSRSWADRDIDGNMRGERAAYRAIGDGRYLLIATSVYGEQISEAKRNAHVATLTEWFASLEEGQRKAVTDEKLTALVVQLDEQDKAAAPGTVTRCDLVPVPDPPGGDDTHYDPATGHVTLYFSYAGDHNASFTIDRNDPTCADNPEIKRKVDHVVETYENQ